jgi:hypothetical protein
MIMLLLFIMCLVFFIKMPGSKKIIKALVAVVVLFTLLTFMAPLLFMFGKLALCAILFLAIVSII